MINSTETLTYLENIKYHEEIIKEKNSKLPKNYKTLIKKPNILYYIEHFKQLQDLKNSKIRGKEKMLYYILIEQYFYMFETYHCAFFSPQEFYLFPKEITHRCYSIGIKDFYFENDTIFLYTYFETLDKNYYLAVHKLKEKVFYFFRVQEIPREKEFPYRNTPLFFEKVKSFIKNRQNFNVSFAIPFNEIFFSVGEGWKTRQKIAFKKIISRFEYITKRIRSRKFLNLLNLL